MLVVGREVAAGAVWVALFPQFCPSSLSKCSSFTSAVRAAPSMAGARAQFPLEAVLAMCVASLEGLAATAPRALPVVSWWLAVVAHLLTVVATVASAGLGAVCLVARESGTTKLKTARAARKMQAEPAELNTASPHWGYSARVGLATWAVEAATTGAEGQSTLLEAGRLLPLDQLQLSKTFKETRAALAVV